MPVKFICHLLIVLSLLPALPAKADGIDTMDQHLFQAQQALAEKGDARAQYYLGEMYEQGLGTAENLDEAFKWYARAAKQGDALAKQKLAHRAEIEADVKVAQEADGVKFAPTPEIQNDHRGDALQVAGKTTAPAATTQTDESSLDKKKMTAQKVTETEKRRALVRAMLLEHQKHPLPEPFE